MPASAVCAALCMPYVKEPPVVLSRPSPSKRMGLESVPDLEHKFIPGPHGGRSPRGRGGQGCGSEWSALGRESLHRPRACVDRSLSDADRTPSLNTVSPGAPHRHAIQIDTRHRHTSGVGLPGITPRTLTVRPGGASRLESISDANVEKIHILVERVAFGPTKCRVVDRFGCVAQVDVVVLQEDR